MRLWRDRTITQANSATDTIAINTSSSIPIFQFTPSLDVSPSATAPLNRVLASGMLQQAIRRQLNPTLPVAVSAVVFSS